MRAIALEKFSNPSDYNLATLPVPQVTKDDDVLIKVHAASVNPVDVKMASPALGPIMDTKAYATSRCRSIVLTTSLARSLTR